jgi:hypothetical protein
MASISSPSRPTRSRRAGREGQYSGDRVTWTVSGLAAGTAYYWQVVSRTMANMGSAGPVWSVRTAGGEPVIAGEYRRPAARDPR